MNPNTPANIKLVVVGDVNVGKTTVMTTYLYKRFPETLPFYQDQPMQANFMKEGRPVTLNIWDTAGQDDYDRLRPLSYPQTDIFLICFSVVNRKSFERVKSKWAPEVNYHCPKASIILVGLKTDLKDSIDDNGEMQRLLDSGLTAVDGNEGEDMARTINAVKYIECSSRTSINVAKVFDDVADTFLGLNELKLTNSKKSSREEKCVVM